MSTTIRVLQGEVNQNQDNPEKYNVIIRGETADDSTPYVFTGEMDFDEFTDSEAIQTKFEEDFELDA